METVFPIIIGVLFVMLLVCIGLVAWTTWKKKRKEEKKEIKEQPIIAVDTSPFIAEVAALKAEVSRLPEQVLKSITGSVNTKQGKVGELIGFLKLRAAYDVIIPLNNIIDFIGIKYPDKKNPGTVDFIEIKCGPSAALNNNQKTVRKLINSKNVKFITVNIDTSETIITDYTSEKNSDSI